MKNTSKNSANVKNAHEKKINRNRRILQIVVILLIAAVILTYSISFIGSFM